MNNKRCVQVFSLTLIACILLGFSALTLQGFSQQIINDSGIRVFLSDSSDSSHILQVLGTVDGVRNMNLISGHLVLEQFQETLGYQWNGPNPLPDMVEVTVHPQEAEKVYGNMQGLGGIDYISYPAEAMANLRQINSLIEQVVGVLLLFTIGIGSIGSLKVVALLRAGDLQCDA